MLRQRREGEQCNCENSRCDHQGPCPKLAGDTYIEQIGYVCDSCAKEYPDRYKVSADPPDHSDDLCPCGDADCSRPFGHAEV